MWVANAVQVLTSLKLSRVYLTTHFVPYYVKCYEPAGTQQDAYLLNQLGLTTKISQEDEYFIVNNQPTCTNSYVWHENVVGMGSVA
jgi:hypothetical protein